MAIQSEQLMQHSKKLVAVCIGLMFLLGLVLIAQGFIDTKNYREDLQRIVKDAIGQDISIKGKVTVSLLPVPTLYVPGVELHSGDPNTTEPSLTADMVYIRASALSLFSDHLEVSSIVLERPSLEVQRDDKGHMQWSWLAAAMDHAAGVAEGRSVAFEVIDGKLLYRNNEADNVVGVKRINVSGHTGAGAQVEGTLVFDDRLLSLEMSADAAQAGVATPLSILLSASDESRISLKGSADFSVQPFVYNAALDVSFPDLLFWIKPSASAEAGIGAAAEKIPFALTGQWKQTGWDADVAEAKLEGVASSGSGAMHLSLGDIPAVDVAMQFDRFGFEAWQSVVFALAERKKSLMPVKLYKDDSDVPTTILPKALKMGFDVKAETLVIGGQEWKNAALKAQMADAAVTVNQFGVELPGDASLTLFGIVSEGGAKNLRFEGSMETQGKSLRSVLTIIDPSAVELPETGFGDFYAHANIFVSPEQVRLSEADVKINELLLSGGMVAYFDSKPRVEADVKLKDINFDYFRDVWRDKQSENKAEDYFLKIDKSVNFNWLRKLKTGIDFKVIVDHFTFLDRKGDTAAFRLFAKDGEFGIYNARFYYPDDTIEANFTLNVNGDTPFINLIFNTSQELNSGYFSDTSADRKDVLVLPQANVGVEEKQEAVPEMAVPEPPKAVMVEEALPADASISEAAAQSAKKERWPTALLDMSWMEGINGSFDITAGRMVHKNYNFNRVKLKAKLDNKLLTFQSLSFLYWQGRCDVTGSLYGGKVPGMSVGFTVYNAELQDILKTFAARDTITGKVGISGTIQTSGVNLLSWLSQADAKMTLAGRGVNVENFNIQGVVDTVGVSRTTADVVNNVNLVIQKGATQFNVDGYVNVKNGTVKTPGITLKTGNITGNLTGDVRLVPWTMDLSVLFQFPSMPSDTVPTMVVKLTGPIDDPALQTDTDSLEAYVSKRIIGR